MSWYEFPFGILLDIDRDTEVIAELRTNDGQVVDSKRFTVAPHVNHAGVLHGEAAMAADLKIHFRIAERSESGTTT